MMKRHMMKRANLWSVYQWYGISPSVDPVTVSYKEIHTRGEQVRMNMFYLLHHEGISIEDDKRFTKASFTFCLMLNKVVYDFLMAR